MPPAECFPAATITLTASRLHIGHAFVFQWNQNFARRAIAALRARPPCRGQTGLTGKYDITLKWTPADAQPGADAPPDLYTAIQEQLGLKLVATKAMDKVLVIDQVERPSEN